MADYKKPGLHAVVTTGSKLLLFANMSSNLSTYTRSTFAFHIYIYKHIKENKTVILIIRICTYRYVMTSSNDPDRSLENSCCKSIVIAIYRQVLDF